MMIYEMEHPENAAPLFEGWQETLIWSCLQNVMGHIYTNAIDTPMSAMAILGDFCFFAGKPERELVLWKPEWCRQDFMIMVPENEAWARLIEDCYGEKAKKVIRYATKKEPDVFDKAHLQKIVDALLPEYTLKSIDEELFSFCRKISWCQDFVAQYEDFETFQKHGLGVLVFKGSEPVSGASSYSAYHGGIEIEIDTHKDYRRRGLASTCGAKLILECLERSLYPSWDAQNLWSLSLAKKLGYHFDHEYVSYEIWGY